MADKIYCYPDTDTLINRLNIHDAGRLLEAETRIVSIRLVGRRIEGDINGKLFFQPFSH